MLSLFVTPTAADFLSTAAQWSVPWFQELSPVTWVLLGIAIAPLILLGIFYAFESGLERVIEHRSEHREKKEIGM